MKTRRLVSMILCSLLFFSVNCMAQGFLEGVLKAAGDAAIDEAVDGIKGKKSSKKPAATKKVTGFKVVSPHPDLEIEMTRCIASGKTVVIDFVLTNHGSDTEICLAGGEGTTSKVYDDEGNVYSYNNVLISVAGSNLTSSWTRNLIYPTDVPIKCRMQIEKVEESVLNFSRINLVGDCNSMGLNRDKPILFHNVPITREE